MAYPDKPDLDYSYTGFQQSQGDNSFPGTYVDIDLAALKAAIDETIDFLTTSFQSTGILKVNYLPGGDVLDEYIASTAADVVLTHADVVLTHADVVLTHADVVLTHADVVLTHADAAATAADRVQTGLDRVATAADRVQTGLDRVATAADRVQTGLDKVATAADRVQTGLDKVATAADRVQTGVDATTATTQAGLAQAAATAAANSLDSFDDRYLGAKAADPTLDNDGNALLDGALYWNTSTGLKIYHLGTTTWNAYSAATGISNVVEDTTPQLGGQLDVNGQALGDGTSELLKFSETASAVNEITIGNAATGNGPTLSATGDDTNIDLNLAGKGTGVPKIGGAAVVKASGSQNLTGGFTCTSLDQGTKSSGTFTPDLLTGPVQHYTNGGAHTLAPPTGNGSVLIDMTNNASAGAVTTSGFTKVTGDTLTTTNGNKFRFFITVGNGGSHLHKQALQ